MTRVRIAGIALAVALTTSSVFAAPVGPELDPGSAVGGAAVLLIGGAYLIERFRRRR